MACIDQAGAVPPLDEPPVVGEVEVADAADGEALGRGRARDVVEVVGLRVVHVHGDLRAPARAVPAQREDLVPLLAAGPPAYRDAGRAAGTRHAREEGVRLGRGAGRCPGGQSRHQGYRCQRGCRGPGGWESVSHPVNDHRGPSVPTHGEVARKTGKTGSRFTPGRYLFASAIACNTVARTTACGAGTCRPTVRPQRGHTGYPQDHPGRRKSMRRLVHRIVGLTHRMNRVW